MKYRICKAVRSSGSITYTVEKKDSHGAWSDVFFNRQYADLNSAKTIVELLMEGPVYHYPPDYEEVSE